MRTLRRAAAAVLLASLLALVLAVGTTASAGRTLKVSASISNHHPKQYTKVTVYCKAKDQNGKPISGVKCTFTWHYKTTTPVTHATTNSKGVAHSTRFISRATKGYKVVVSIRATWKGQAKKCSTWFIPK